MPTDKDNTPRLDLIDASKVIARGCWRVEVLALPGTINRLKSTIHSYSGKTGIVWDLTQIPGAGLHQRPVFMAKLGRQATSQSVSY